MADIQVNNLLKIFGSNHEAARKLVQNGVSRDDILERTGCTVAVRDATFRVGDASIFVVMGLSGSGKSTLLRCLNRLIEATDGQVLIDGEDIADADDHRLREIRSHKVGMVFQHFALLPHRSVLANVEFGLEIRGTDPETRRKKAEEALGLVGLEPYGESRPDELSGGMQQRVGLARALATDPEILLMDEAFSALDPLIRTEMQDELIALQSRLKKTIVFITHDLNEALKLGDRIAIMKDGAIVQIGGSEEILTKPADDYVRAFTQDVDRSRVITTGSILKPAARVQVPRDGPGMAVRTMREQGIASLFVTDAERRIQGIVRIEDAGRLVKQDVHELSGAVIEEVPTAGLEDPLSDLLPIASDEFPIAVLDDDRRLCGIVTRSAIIAALAGEEGVS